MSESASISDLMRGAQDGHTEDLDCLLAEFRPMVYRWALVWTGSPDVADDVAQTVLVRVHRSFTSCTPGASITTWLYRITKNVLIDYERAHGRDNALRDRVRLERVATAAAEDKGVRSLEAVDLLQHLMSVLSPQQRAAMDLVLLQGYTTSEAAGMMEVAPATVRVHLHRARETLRSRLGGEGSAEGTYG